MSAPLLCWLYSLALSGAWRTRSCSGTVVSSTGPTIGLAVLILTTGPVSTLMAQQHPRAHFRNYSTEHGLSSPETYCAFQDSRGYMWFGTDNGVSRFDGYEFRTYDGRDGLTSNVVFDIYEDAKGRIWFGTMTGEVFILEGDTILPYRFNHLVKQYERSHYGVKLSHLDPDDETAYFSLQEVGVMVVDSLGRDSLITSELPISRLLVKVKGLPYSLFVPVLDRSRPEEIMLDDQYEKEHKIARFEFTSKSGSTYIRLPVFRKYATIRNIKTQKLSSGHFLIYHDKYLYCLKEGSLLWYNSFNFGPDFRINEIIEREDGAILFCMAEGNGLRVYRDIEALREGVFDLYLNGLSASNIFEDGKTGLWIVTQEKGVFYSPNLELLIYDSRFGFSDDFVSAVTFKSEYELYAGCYNGDIFQVDVRDNQITGKLVSFYGYHNHDLLYQPETDLLWSNSTYWKDNRWNFVNFRSRLSGEMYPFRTSKLDKLHINAAGELLGCSYGLTIIDTKHDSVKFHPVENNFTERTFALHTDSNQRLWVGNARGLFEFRDSVLISPGIDHPAFRIRVEDIHEFPDGKLVFGTKGQGVVRWWEETVLQLTTDDGLTSNMIEDVHVDETGVLWAGTLNGLNKITFDAVGKPEVRTFTVASGLPSNEIYKVKSYAGQVWLCTAGGLVKFHEPEKETLAAAPIIQYLNVNGDEVPLASKQEFKHRQNNLEFNFLAINYRQNGRIPYRYRLNEAADWQYTQNLSVNYPKLPSDDYRFEVQAQNQDGYWSSSTTYAFSIQPPWWRTCWARGGVAGIVLAGLFYYRQREMAKFREEVAVKQKIAELERSALQAQMNPHFIFNCLNSIQNFILQNDRKQAVEYLSRFAQLVRHNLNASVQGKVSLKEELSLLDNYLALERERFEQRFDYTIAVDEALNQQFIAFPPLLIQPYVENAIIHGLLKKKDKGEVVVHFSEENEHITVSIRDNGPGYQPELKRRRNSRHKSVGMTITQKRLELLGNSSEKVVQISALKGEEGVSGTEVKIFIDINQKS